jgi:hypothetical protein
MPKVTSNDYQNARNKDRRDLWLSSWQKAYTDAIREALKGKTCNAPGCPCGNKAAATHFLKTKRQADLAKPSQAHGFGEVIAQINAGKVGCDLAKKTTRPTYKKIVDRQAEAVAAKFGINADEARAVLEAAKKN